MIDGDKNEFLIGAILGALIGSALGSFLTWFLLTGGI